VNVLVLGGDIAGKMVVPILDLGGGRYRSTIQSLTRELEGDDELAAFASGPASSAPTPPSSRSMSTTRCRPSPARVDALYHDLARERMAQWIEFAEERLAGTGIVCYVTGGNDDAPDILEPLISHDGKNVVDCEGKARGDRRRRAPHVEHGSQ
jgi:uncharacterized protein